MNSQTFDQQLKRDALAFRFKIEGSYLVFDKNSDLTYQVTENFNLKELLTKNPAVSYTKLHKSVILKLQRIRESLQQPITINSTYRDFYYNKRCGGATESQHLKGNAID
ncbi:MAG: D-Ala-D-Ala carboxypeptidase family metallohydrolase, partial [Daejeonella sp.]|uniref:D-Ala-D-Ala carboxypeptidase family metallohydrolase n=1 Tax=Daejeonella sp. TaxID=2805397 RepID=UPI003C725F25